MNEPIYKILWRLLRDECELNLLAALFIFPVLYWFALGLRHSFQQTLHEAEQATLDEFSEYARNAD